MYNINVLHRIIIAQLSIARTPRHTAGITRLERANQTCCKTACTRRTASNARSARTHPAPILHRPAVLRETSQLQTSASTREQPRVAVIDGPGEPRERHRPHRSAPAPSLILSRRGDSAAEESGALAAGSSRVVPPPTIVRGARRRRRTFL